MVRCFVLHRPIGLLYSTTGCAGVNAVICCVATLQRNVLWEIYSQSDRVAADALSNRGGGKAAVHGKHASAEIINIYMGYFAHLKSKFLVFGYIYLTR